MIEVSDEGREATAELKDHIASFGERISAQVMAAALESAVCPHAIWTPAR